jgi:hypothetical protein
MRLKLLFILSFILCVGAKAQQIKLKGNINDTTAGGLMSNSVLMALRFQDSSLVGYSRPDKQGVFKTITVPVDTYLVFISNPNFSDKTFLLVPNKNDTAFNFKNIILPPKSIMLNEVEIVAAKEKMYYKGDTLMFTADSFKLKQDATVEDLLKKLPGVKVDAQGKITVQGKEVSQVLVDGDEFFGSDPTVATKNLNAKAVENVQVYEKKNEDAESKDETVKVMNLQLKEEAKKGYFGKVSAASDFQKFYEGELLLNRFKKNRKYSIFGLAANTPKQAFAGNDAWTYGRDNEQGWNYDPESNSWTSSGNNKPGIPQTMKGGFYFNDKIGKKIKINTDYTFKQNQITTAQETNTQYFLTDTTYSNAKKTDTKAGNQSHNFNLRWTQTLDSLTELTIKPKINYVTSSSSNFQSDKFISAADTLTRETSINTKGNSETKDVNVMMRLQRNFKKKDRQLSLTYQPSYYNQISKTDLTTEFKYYQGQANDSTLQQKRTQENNKLEHNATLNYTEPLTKKFKVETGYGFSYNENSNNRETRDFNGIAFDALNTTQSNNFKNTRISNRAGAKLIYEVKKYRISAGANYRNIYQENINVTTGQKLSLNVNNVLPTASFNYRPNQGSNLSLFYNMNAQLPEIKQLQPVTDNTDPNNIRIGNPDLKQSFTNNVNLNYYFYKGISDVNLWAGGTFNNTIGEVTDKTYYDTIGRAVITPVNINGNYFGNAYLGGGFPVFKKFMKIEYNFNVGHSNNVGYVNDKINVTQNTNYAPGLTFEKEIGEDIEIRIGGDYTYNVPKQTISLQTSNNKPYYTYGLNASLRLKLVERLNFFAEADYTNNGNRAVGYNIDYTIVNASISYTFLKDKSLIVGFEANDILNQNINNRRDVQSNKIVDTKTQIIRQYFLGRITYKFTSQKEKKGEDEDE